MVGSILSLPSNANEYIHDFSQAPSYSMIRMIAACARNRIMGAGGTLPWKTKEDWQYFLQTTANGVMLMGRICYEDFTEYTSTRKVVVLSRNQNISFNDAQKASNLSDGLRLAQSMGKDVWICGGEEIYRDAMPLAEELYLTQIDADFSGDVQFPDWRNFFKREISRKELICQGKKLTFLIL